MDCYRQYHVMLQLLALTKRLLESGLVCEQYGNQVSFQSGGPLTKAPCLRRFCHERYNNQVFCSFSQVFFSFNQVFGFFSQVFGSFSQVFGSFSQVFGSFSQVFGSFNQVDQVLPSQKHLLEGGCATSDDQVFCSLSRVFSSTNHLVKDNIYLCNQFEIIISSDQLKSTQISCFHICSGVCFVQSSA
jgi:hypothetical protein